MIEESRLTWGVLATAVVLLTLPPLRASSPATMIRVPADHPTIQAGIDAAAHGDTVDVQCGTYYEHDIVMKSGVTLRSESSSPDCVTIDAAQLGRVIYCLSVDAHTVFEGLTFMGGDRPQTRGGGVLCMEESSPRFIRCSFKQNSTGRHGGGLACYGEPSPVIEDCSFTDNTAYTGGGMSCTVNSAPKLRGCKFSGNSATTGGGLGCMSPGASPTLVDCVFTRNIATSGGGVYCGSGASPILDRCEFSFNRAVHGGGMRTISGTPSFPRLTQVVCVGNGASYEGGGLMFANGAPVLEFVTVVDNFAPIGSGVFVGDGAAVAMDNAIIAFNSGIGGVHVHDLGTAELVCSDIYGNSGGDWIGDLAVQLGVDGNICEDPLFCGDDVPGDPLSLHIESPCAPDNSGSCGLIGARDVGCGETAVELSTWGSIKARYR